MCLDDNVFNVLYGNSYEINWNEFIEDKTFKNNN